LPDDAPVNAVRADPVQPGCFTLPPSAGSLHRSERMERHWQRDPVQPAPHFHARFAREKMTNLIVATSRPLVLDS